MEIGDKIKEKFCKYNNLEYCILNYNRNSIDYFNDDSANYRSIVLSYPENQLLCFSCPKSISYDLFIEDYPVITDDILVNDIIEGTMINVFYDIRIFSWVISTKKAIGGNYWYFRNQYYNTEKSQKTFYDMFLESLQCNNINNLSFLNKKYCYNFVLQHPENHIVLHIEKPACYLVSMYELDNSIHGSNNSVHYISPAVFSKWECFNNTSVLFPTQYENETYSSLSIKYNSLYNDYCNIGVMLTNIHTGERIHIKNIAYENVKVLRGNNPNLLYQYICLMRSNRIYDYLNIFPQYKKMFSKFYNNYTDFIQNIYNAYVNYYIKKDRNTKISKKYLYHIHTLHHQIYIPSLCNKQKTDAENFLTVGLPETKPIKITKEVIYKYINDMSPMQIFHYLQS